MRWLGQQHSSGRTSRSLCTFLVGRMQVNPISLLVKLLRDTDFLHHSCHIMVKACYSHRCPDEAICENGVYNGCWFMIPSNVKLIMQMLAMLSVACINQIVVSKKSMYRIQQVDMRLGIQASLFHSSPINLRQKN
jgi:hypothetical protein